MKLNLNLPFLKSIDKSIVEIPDDSIVLKPTVAPITNVEKLIDDSIAHPISSEPLSSFVKSNNKILIVVNDATRFTPTSIVLDRIVGYLADNEIWIIVATGAHRSPTNKELNIILGKHYDSLRERVIIHDAMNESSMSFYGTTHRDTEVNINSIVDKVDGIIVIGSTEPHYFAGYTGGRKGIVPGIASYDTIEQNHKLALSKEAKILRLVGNPVHEDLIEAVSFVLKEKDIFAINTVLDGRHTLYKVTSGDIFKSHELSAKFSDEIFVKNVNEFADIVIAVVPPPLDINLYQAHKAIENSKLCVRDGGIIILVASCWEGIGPENFYKLLSMGKDFVELKEFVEKHYKLGYHKALRLAETFEKADVYAVTSLRKDVLERIGITPFSTPQKALNVALNKLGIESRVLISLDAAVTVPVPSKKV